MKLKIRQTHILLLLVIPTCVYANDPFAKLPSGQSQEQLNQMTTPVEPVQTRDWWSGSNSGGPPSGGEGGGGAVGMALTDGGVPVFVAGLLYVSFIALKRHRKKHQV